LLEFVLALSGSAREMKMAIKVVNKSLSATKSGAGSVHSQGHKKASPIKTKGAGVGFVLRIAPKEKRARTGLRGRGQVG
jgi:hypothetical protein